MKANEIKAINAKISDFKDDNLNANRGTEIGAKKLKNSIEKHGLGRSILVDRNGRIIAGNKAKGEAISQGYEDAIIIKTKGNQLVAVQREDIDLDSEAGRDLAISDNRVSESNLNWSIENLHKISESTGIDLGKVWSKNELDILDNRFKSEKEIDSSKLESEAERYKNNSIMQIVFYYDNETYEEVLEQVATIKNELNCYDQSEILERLIGFYQTTKQKIPRP